MPKARIEHVCQQYVAERLEAVQQSGLIVFGAAVQDLYNKSARQVQYAKLLGMQPGEPDIWVGRKGRTLFVEFKTPGRSATPKQKDRQAMLREQGFMVATITAKTGVEAWDQMQTILLSHFDV